MITILGPTETREYGYAQKLRELIATAWPEVETDHRNDVKIISDVKCYGQKFVDIDIVLLMNLWEPMVIGSVRPEKDPIYLQSLCCTIELKEQEADKFHFEGNQVKVKYGPREWHSVSYQSFQEQVSLRNYLNNHNVEPPYVIDLIWLPNYPENRLPNVTHNVVGRDATWETFVRRIQGLNPPSYRTREGIEISAAKEISNAYWQQISDILAKEMEVSALDRTRIEAITARSIGIGQYNEKLGSQILIFRGRAGTGKTMRLLQLANKIYQEQDKRILLLTYNLALMSDIKRLLVLLHISDGIGEGSIAIKTVHSFVGQILYALDILSGQGDQFMERYDNYKAEALELLAAAEPADIADMMQERPEDFCWDYILVDEAQDWPEDERDILFSIYNFKSFVLADGVDQLIRKHKKTDWRANISRQQSQIVSLTKSLRLKAGLCRFVLALAHKLDLSNWNVEPNQDVYGGRVIIIEGSYAASRSLHDEIMADHIKYGNSPIDMLFCIPPNLVPRRGKEVVQLSTVGQKLVDWGCKVWDGSGENVRNSYPTDLAQIRIVQYDSCRGLEGWTVVNIGFDEFFDYKKRTYKPSPEAEQDMFFNAEQAAYAYVYHWLLIPLTRAIDTIVIHISSAQHPIGRILRAVADECSDVVEWRKVTEPQKEKR